ncbi:ABC transporter substrate-binding protein [Mesorhizobium sp. M8A.F.Ca.ET.208.01.1.1]|uniref:ABC transporter substrate-binding protein n=1 Tax=unclassified Mesorhizobium TaxID=325217 RepID=UPI000F74E50E|nr:MULTISPECIES: ABC transporter substrate-binding protein [unclassified Mesorhizobium]AZO54368.1 ABC transporter substrate-binding protein [Mesorhizobium sp. M8A.F.Ca.ET.057.01.1.1]RWE49809.1 MAG: ABC transporter substrate-binding protein [Mesorhizobium sp.]TGQ94539.1 ABC transporter substrate-binding protein [Mesorhizobium sp. M8A.F.Ca.ET.208.01.1.1]TGT55027.1 ABC transporter substrate-binding protein [Mesorhizobium sp. M8A.F.Ca.ET.167.01.1.1]
MKTSALAIAISTALGWSIVAPSAWAQTVPENLKGSGEVIVTSGGGAWEAAQRKAFFEPFTRDTGIKVVVVPQDDGKMLASVKLGQPAADITEINGGSLPTWVNKSAAEEIDYSLFGKDTLKGVPDYLKSKYGVGAVIFSLNVAYNTKVFSETNAPRNWVDFYNVDAYPGKRGLPKCESMLNGGLLETALLGDGVSPQALYPLDVERAFAKITKMKPNVGRWWVAGADAPQSLVSGEVDMAASYNGRIISAKKQGAPLALSWDQALLQYDYWVVLKDAPNKENAFKFLAYISQAKPQAAFSTEIPYGPINSDAFALLSKDLVEALPGAPERKGKEIPQNYEWWGQTQADGRTNYELALERCVSILSQ